MPHTSLFEALKENIRVIYRQSIDADKKLDELRQQDMAKFAAIFNEQQGFKTKANRFTPYAEELGNDLVALQQGNPDDVATNVQPLVSKIEIQLQLLQVFKSNLKAKPAEK
ncbi:prephenate dehydrogenase [Psychrobium sp. MM17-31]|uniref:prephenate dehydrogenase n=1 Tax=Psychrobium sp. MM17-31 TaxID=2917758 RepID=UPI001EF643DD|nr:prephenate dehydrogenase [Psychrobium sp. MM17-31]MCG7532508.1 prephenate dehydrogenase [Psychrobium sp. MM17-31]